MIGQEYNLFNFSTAKILVVGDIVLDTYWFGSTNRTSPEAPVPIAHYHKSEDRLAGAGDIAAVLANLGAKTKLISALSSLSSDARLRDLLNTAQLPVTPDYIVPTTLSQTQQRIRIVSQTQQLLRIDNAAKLNNSSKLQDTELSALNKNFLNNYKEHDTVLFYDEGQGVVEHQYLHSWLKLAQNSHIKTLYVPANQTALNNFINNNLQADYIITQKKFDIAESKLLLAVRSGLVTYQENGLSVYNFYSNNNFIINKLSCEVENVIGTIEMLAALFTLGLSTTNDIKSASEIANAGVSFAKRQFGQYLINIVELQLAYADYLLNSKYNFINLKREIDTIRAKNKTIIFANGCFDILHVGHLAYLDLAKQRGDKLFVAINSDCSIKRLKGSERPINNLSDRIDLLKALSCQDWVVPFFTDTPEDFLRWLQPDILVKGGDYTPEQIVGHEIVHSYGGKTEIIDHPYNMISSTKILAKADVNYV
ncbi:MAG: bifunctional heptose 7-phosphate kinase/heptose 1-phosphate adenyltransferase [Gammaproteobacteria bacterium]|nr:bifunctional heptose 7-phosphate kinase/heptose 1-phosphate adenyltransferase [Gammaproteobacteria bacterium]